MSLGGGTPLCIPLWSPVSLGRWDRFWDISWPSLSLGMEDPFLGCLPAPHEFEEGGPFSGSLLVSLGSGDTFLCPLLAPSETGEGGTPFWDLLYEFGDGGVLPGTPLPPLMTVPP